MLQRAFVDAAGDAVAFLGLGCHQVAHQAGALRFLWSFLLPLSWANIAALFVVLFIYGWNEYFWPLLITNTESMRTVVIGLERLIPRSGTEQPTWNLIMAGAMMALLPPVAVIVFMQRWFVKGLVESEK